MLLSNELAELKQLITDKQKNILFLTGAGVSVPSGIPDYRSKTGVYAGLENPEYMLSHSCLVNEPERFYQFVMENLYFPDAKPNIIHQKIAQWEKENGNVAVVTQNVDNLHQKAGSENIVAFHGSLYKCYCQKCLQEVPVADYLISPIHKGCGGYLRGDTVLYEEMLPEENIQAALSAVSQADVIVIAGTSFKVAPFCQLINYRKKDSRIFVMNKEDLHWSFPYEMLQGDAAELFESL